MGNLKNLQKHREDILRAEVAAWLHDIGKAKVKQEWIQEIDEALAKWLETHDPTNFHLQSERLDRWLMAQAHGLGHFDKQEPDTNDSKGTTVDTPFGYALKPVQHLNKRHPWLQSRETISSKTLAQAILTHFYADSRLPINEVTLWSWAETTGSLVKASWAHAILKNILLNEQFKNFAKILSNLETQRIALIQRQDPQIGALLNELEAQIPGKSFGTNFKGYATDGQGGSPLRDFNNFLDEWLPRAKQVQSQTRLTHKKWASFLENLENLHTQLKTALGLLQWRLLSLRTDGLAYMLSAPSIPDLLARKELLTDAWNRVQKVLEE